MDQVGGEEVGGCGEEGEGLGEGAAAGAEEAPFGEEELVGWGAEEGGDGEEGHACDAACRRMEMLVVVVDMETEMEISEGVRLEGIGR